ncbi:MAG: hypothetical protein WCM76_09185 [Bacteroidota bacterium]
MKLFKRKEIILISDYTLDSVVKILERKMELSVEPSVEGTYLYETLNGTSSQLDNFALLQCWVENNENKTEITVWFRPNVMFIILLAITILFGIAGIFSTLSKNDASQLIGFVPFVLVFLFGQIVSAFNKRNKVMEMERLLHCSSV